MRCRALAHRISFQGRVRGLLLGVYFSSSTLQNHALVALLIYIALFAVGLGQVFWLMISEIYPIGIRSKAMSVSTLGNWAASRVYRPIPT